MSDSDLAPTAAAFAPLAASADTLPAGLPQLVEQLWKRIAQGLDGRWPPWGLPMLATQSPEGPRARVLALRHVDPARRCFTFHADARSDKVRELLADARASVVFWDPGDAIEARFTGIATVHRANDVARAAWEKVSPLRRHGSKVLAAPGTELAASEGFEALATSADDGAAFRNFAVIEVVAAAIDWLWLGPRDLRRAALRWTGTQWAGKWIVP